jgi:hypothetical protein
METLRERDILNAPRYQQTRPALLELVGQLQAAETDADFWDLQQWLFGSLRGRQEDLTRLRHELDDLREQRRLLTARYPKPDTEVRELQARIAGVEHRVDVEDAVRHLRLTIGDGLAWKRLGYDRATITILGRGERVAWLSDGRGLQAETDALDAYRAQGHFALLNDLTTCLRHGDVTVFEPGRCVIYEVKAGAKADEASPQMRRLREAVKFVNTGQTEAGAEPGAAIRSIHRYRTHLAQLPALLREAGQRGAAARMVSDCQFVAAFDVRFFVGAASLPPLALPGAVRKAAGWPAGDLVFDMSAVTRRMRDRHGSFAILAPLSIYPLPAEQVCDVMMGWLTFSTLLNATRLAQSLRRYGIAAEPITPPESENGFLRVGVPTAPGQGVEGTLHSVEREMMLLELMTPATLRAGIETLADAMADAGADARRLMVFHGDEQATWSRARSGS